MDIMTKVRVLWEKVAGITADVSAVDAKATATAATLAGILPRIPKDYSTTETATGVKWIDGKPLYCIVLEDNFGVITETQNIIAGTIGTNLNIKDITLMVKSPSNNYIKLANTVTYLSGGGSGGSVNINGITATYSEGSYIIIIYYTKPDPVPAQADNETRKRKTTKKEEK